jgi:fructose-1-phosphate kinase PfkB-like protein
MKKSRPMLVLGANPAWQQVLFFKHLEPGRVNRAERSLNFPSGKGINFCRAARIHGVVPTLLLQFTGGRTGDLIAAGLDEAGFRHLDVRIDGASRICTTCCCRQSGRVTELIEPAGAAGERQVDEMLARFEAELPESELAALCGTLPPGTPARLCVEAARLAAAAKKPLLVDSVESTFAVLQSGGESILKINREELQMLTGESDLKTALRQLAGRFPIRAAAITDGPEDAWLLTLGRLFRYRIPRLETVVNPIGSGDTAGAVLASEFLAGRPLNTAFAAAIGAAIDNCRSAVCGEFDPAAARETTGQIEIFEESFQS